MTRGKWTEIPLEAGEGGVFFRRGGPDHAVNRGVEWSNPSINVLLWLLFATPSIGIHGLE
jgi:hypothetical protein